MGIAGSIGGAAGRAAGEKVTKEVLGKCRTDKEGNIYTENSRMFHAIIIFVNVFFSLAMVGLIALFLFAPEDEYIKDPVILLICAVGCIFIFLMNLLYNRTIKCKYTLLLDGLKIEKGSLKITVSYPEVKEWMTKYPPVEYRFFYSMIISNTLIRYNFSLMIGALGFLAALCELSGVPVPDIKHMEEKIRKGCSSDTKEDKLAYINLKQYAKQLKH